MLQIVLAFAFAFVFAFAFIFVFEFVFAFIFVFGGKCVISIHFLTSLYSNLREGAKGWIINSFPDLIVA